MRTAFTVRFVRAMVPSRLAILRACLLAAGDRTFSLICQFIHSLTTAKILGLQTEKKSQLAIFSQNLQQFVELSRGESELCSFAKIENRSTVQNLRQICPPPTLAFPCTMLWSGF